MALISRAFAFEGKDAPEKFFYFSLIIPLLSLPILILNFAFLTYARQIYDFIRPGLDLLGIATIAMAAIILFLAGCRRSRDIGWSPWWALLLAVPPISVAVYFVFLFHRGRPAAPRGM